MPDPQIAKRTPLSSSPVGNIVGEFIDEKRKELQEEKARSVPKKRSPFVLPLLIVLCVAVWFVPSFLPSREPTLSPATIERGARLSLYLASLRIRQYQARHLQLPATLDQAGVDTTGVSYSRLGNTFELSTQVLGAKMIYRSTQPDSLFLGPDRIRGL